MAQPDFGPAYAARMSDIGNQPFDAAAHGINTQLQPMDIPQTAFDPSQLVQTPLPTISYTAQPGDSVSTIMGSSDPTAVGTFMLANGLTTSTVIAGQDYILPGADIPGATAIGQAALNADNARINAIDNAEINGTMGQLDQSEALFNQNMSNLNAQLGAGSAVPDSSALSLDLSGGFGGASASISGGYSVEGFGQAFEGAKLAVEGEGVFTSGVLAASGVDAEAVANAAEGVGKMFIEPAALVLTVAGQASLAIGDMNHGISAPVAITGHAINTAAIIGAGAIGTAVAEGAIEGAELGSFLGPWGTVLGAGAGALAAWYVAEHAPTGQQWNQALGGASPSK